MQADSGNAVHRSVNYLLRALALCLSLQAGCSSDDNGNVPTTGDTMSETSPTSVADDPSESSSAADDAIPDPNARPGLVVRGLGMQAAEDVSVGWFASTQLFRNNSAAEAGDADVVLNDYDSGIAFSEVLDFYAPELDTCELAREPTPENEEDDGGSPPPAVSGGTPVTINSSNGPVLVLQQSLAENGSDLTYSADLLEPLPEDAVLTIPGDQFPSVTGYPSSEPPAPVRLMPTIGEPLDRESVFSWMPGSGENFIELAFAAFDSSGSFIDFPIRCAVVDDGSFELPDDAIAFLESTTDEVVLHVERTRRVVELADGITFYARSTVRE